MSFSPQAFKAVMGRFATGVTVVTTCDGERRVGITVNAFASLSLDPPLVLICIERVAAMHDILSRAGVFAVNILTDDQRDLPVCFATRSEHRYNAFCGASSHTVATGAPIIDGVLGYVDCRVVDIFPGGDHSIFIGHVVALGDAGSHATNPAPQPGAPEDPPGSGPLVYYHRNYRHIDGSQS